MAGCINTVLDTTPLSTTTVSGRKWITWNGPDFYAAAYCICPAPLHPL